ncbi:hypothetical protein OV079_52965 [Nannocystis pusilla]|uniref:Membrane dipeptidase n=1 Tax=Nannocystis pusilla TaxID=889268 RepID=A0A9X3F125_9BACT|nr:hypothetical protein [Nannocystis pusilla]MCY1014092.1 hypothetical protein [Nannocystis pusilla]
MPSSDATQAEPSPSSEAMQVGAPPGLDPSLAADPALQRAHAVLARVPLIDGHNDLPWTIREHKDAPGVAAYGLRAATKGTPICRGCAGRVGASSGRCTCPAIGRPATWCACSSSRSIWRGG